MGEQASEIGPGPAAGSEPLPGAADSDAGRTWPGSPVRRGLGVALLGLAGAGRFTVGQHPVAGPGASLPAEPLLDVALGAVDLALEIGERLADAARRRLDPVLRAAMAPAAPIAGVPSLGARLIGVAAAPLARRGRRLRTDCEREAAAAVAAVLPQTIDSVMDQVDLTGLAVDRLDIQRVLEAAVAQVDLTGFALEHLDLARLIQASLDSVDFTGLAIDKIDFSRTVSAALDQVDIVMLAREQLDPARVAAYVRDTVDITETLRAAPAAVAGEAVRGVRERVERMVAISRT